MAIKRSKQLTDMFYNFLENRQPQVRSRELRSVFFGYLQLEMKAGMNTDLTAELSTVSDLMDILDVAAEQKKSPA